MGKWIKLELMVEGHPTVWKKCPKCKKKTHFMNTGNFRVNANGRRLDVWLIHQCENCKTNWNMGIYERVFPSSLSQDLYQKLMLNDEELVTSYSWDTSIYKVNKVEICYDSVNYWLLEKMEGTCDEGDLVLAITCPFTVHVRWDKLLAAYLGVTRRKLYEMVAEEDVSILKTKATGNRQFRLVWGVEF